MEEMERVSGILKNNVCVECGSMISTIASCHKRGIYNAIDYQISSLYLFLRITFACIIRTVSCFFKHYNSELQCYNDIMVLVVSFKGFLSAYGITCFLLQFSSAYCNLHLCFFALYIK